MWDSAFPVLCVLCVFVNTSPICDSHVGFLQTGLIPQTAVFGSEYTIVFDSTVSPWRNMRTTGECCRVWLDEVKAKVQASHTFRFSTNTLRRNVVVANITSLGRTENARKPMRNVKPDLNEQKCLRSDLLQVNKINKTKQKLLTFPQGLSCTGSDPPSWKPSHSKGPMRLLL